MALTTTELLADIRRSAMLPSSASDGTTDTDLLAQADKEMQTRIVPMVLRLQQEFYVRTVTTPLVANQGMYPIPRRSMGSRVRTLFYTAANIRQKLARLRPEEKDLALTNGSGYPYGFYLDAANIVLIPPASDTSAVLEIDYYVRANRLVLPTSARQITAVTPGTNYLGAASASRTRIQWSSSIAFGSSIDFVKNAQPFEHLMIGASFNSAGGSVASIDVATSAIIATPEVGDWVTNADEAPVVQAPIECHGLLAQCVASRVLRAEGYTAEADTCDADVQRMTADVVAVLTPRVDGNPSKLAGGVLSQMARGVVNLRRW